jgi:protein TonB
MTSGSDVLEPDEPRRWTMRLVFAAVAVVLLIGAAVFVQRMLDAPAAPKRQVARISILPDTPPPPPPPPKEEKKPEPPKEEPKQVMREEPVRQDVPKQENPQIKMEGAAGDGPSAFGAGKVTQEYIGGTPGAGGGAMNRLAMNSYANAVTRALNEHLAREKDLRLKNYEVNVHVWLNPDGTLRRAQMVGSTGDASIDSTLNESLRRFPGAGRALPEGMPLPLRLLVSNRMLG